MVTMFKPIRAPKEGRSPPGLLYSGSAAAPRRFSPRQATIALIFVVCFLMGYWVLNSDPNGVSLSHSQSTSQGSKDSSAKVDSESGSYRHAKDESPGKYGAKEVLTDDSQAAPGAVNVPEIHADTKSEPKEFKPLGEPLDEVYKKPASQPSPGDVQAEEDKVANLKSDNPKGWTPSGKTSQDKAKPVPGKNKGKSNLAPEQWSERPSFEKKLQHVIDLLPDELNMRELIRPVDGTGKEKLREMGLRTKAYKTYFEAWESLHLATDEEGSTYIRDDVVQYLRSHQHNSNDDDGLSTGTIAQTIRSYESYRSFLTKFANLLFPWTSPYFADHMSLHSHFKKGGKGIVLTAGDDQAPYLLTTIYSFRQLGCDLPIEVMYLGDQDLGEDYRMELEALDGVVTRDIAQMVNDEGWKLAGWAAKPFAILFSSFREVIFIDADSLFFKNPAVLFDDPDYQKNGALFFRDRLIMPENKKRWLQQILPKPIPVSAKQSRFWTGASGHMQESGVIVVDKWRHFIPMLLVTRMNGPDRDGNKDQGRIGVYDMVYGDKETFWIGWLLAGDEEYAFHQGDAGIMGAIKDPLEDRKDLPNPEEVDKLSPEEAQKLLDDIKEKDSIAPTNYTICAPQLLHLDLEGKPLWFNGWLLQNKFVEKSKKKFTKFEHYLVEPREHNTDPTIPAAWQLAEANMCCLTNALDKKFDFDEAERKTLDMIVERAVAVGMGEHN